MNRKKLAAGERVRDAKWGKYSDDLSELRGDGLSNFRRRIARDFRYMRNETQMMLAHTDLVKTELQMMGTYDKQYAEDMSTLPPPPASPELLQLVPPSPVPLPVMPITMVPFS